jgi:hypothetical protein
MKDRKDWLIASISSTFMAAALCLQLPLAAWADDTTVLTPESATIDKPPSSSSGSTAATSSAETTTLYGGARKHLKPPDATGITGTTAIPQNPPVDLGATDNGANLQAASATFDPITLHAQAVKKLAQGLELSADEYRSLGAGCVGYESDRTFFQDIAIVSIVYKDSPAEKAGIRKGDKLIDHENDDEARANPSQPRQEITFDQAGTTTDIIVLHHGQRETLTLTRMNIEDIQEPNIRHEWETIIRRLGSPKGGSFSGTSLKNLKPEQ